MIARVPIDRVEHSALFLAYVEGSSPVLADLLGGFDDAADRWNSVMAPPPGAQLRPDLRDALVSYNERIGASDVVLDRLRAGGDVRFVVTGQQPGPLGGPFLVACKVATAVALAARLEDRFGVPVIPLYWMGSDDVDFAEVRDLTVLATDLAPIDAAIARDAHPAATPVGAIPAGAIASLWQSVAPLVETLPGYAAVSEAVAAALAASTDHAEVTARVLMWMFGGGIAVVDGRAREVRRQARELILDYFDDEDEFTGVVAGGGKLLEESGFHAQIWSAPDSGVFLMQDGARRKIPPEARARARAQFEERIEDASPGVVLRTLIQDSVFQPAAVILGPAEIAYRAQMGPLYERLAIARPVAFPRLSATWVPDALDGVADSTAVDPALVATHPAAFVASVYSSQADPRASEAAEEFLDDFTQARARFLSGLPDIGDDGRKLEKRFADVDRRLRQVLDSIPDGGRAKALAQWPFLAHLEEATLRGKKRQERFMSAISMWLHAPGSAQSALAGAAQGHVEAALDGRIDHVVYWS